MPQPGEQSRQYLQVRKLIENLVKDLHRYNLIMHRAYLARSQRAKHSGSSTENNARTHAIRENEAECAEVELERRRGSVIKHASLSEEYERVEQRKDLGRRRLKRHNGSEM